MITAHSTSAASRRLLRVQIRSLREEAARVRLRSVPHDTGSRLQAREGRSRYGDACVRGVVSGHCRRNSYPLPSCCKGAGETFSALPSESWRSELALPLGSQHGTLRVKRCKRATLRCTDSEFTEPPVVVVVVEVRKANGRTVCGVCSPAVRVRHSYTPNSNTRNRIFSTDCTRHAVSCIRVCSVVLPEPAAASILLALIAVGIGVLGTVWEENAAVVAEHADVLGPVSNTLMCSDQLRTR
eukprot:1133584-Rhodomonas_salina.1